MLVRRPPVRHSAICHMDVPVGPSGSPAPGGSSRAALGHQPKHPCGKSEGHLRCHRRRRPLGAGTQRKDVRVLLNTGVCAFGHARHLPCLGMNPLHRRARPGPRRGPTGPQTGDIRPPSRCADRQRRWKSASRSAAARHGVCAPVMRGGDRSAPARGAEALRPSGPGRECAALRRWSARRSPGRSAGAGGPSDSRPWRPGPPVRE